jgi:type II secretory pathway component PulJ
MRGERGVILLDALVALAILACGLVALVTLGVSALAEVTRARASAAEMERAHHLMGTLTLLSRAEFDQRLGHHDAGDFTIAISRPEVGAYRIAVAPAEAPERDLLVTVVPREEPPQ